MCNLNIGQDLIHIKIVCTSAKSPYRYIRSYKCLPFDLYFGFIPPVLLATYRTDSGNALTRTNLNSDIGKGRVDGSVDGSDAEVVRSKKSQLLTDNIRLKEKVN